MFCVSADSKGDGNIVDSRPFDYAQGKQFRVEEGKIRSLNVETPRPDRRRRRAQRIRRRGETRGGGRGRDPEWEEGAGWKSMLITDFTATHDNFSSYFLYSNDSNGARMRRKLIREMGMRGNLVRENGAGVRGVKASSFRGERSQNSHSEYRKGLRDSGEKLGERPILSTTRPETVGHPNRKRQSQNSPSELRVIHPPRACSGYETSERDSAETLTI